MKRHIACPAITLALACIPVQADDGVVEISDFAASGLAGWKRESFQGETEYRVRDGVLCARADNAASGLYREIPVDLDKTPVLQWSWQVQEGIRPRDERSKAGDDYPARVYVVFSGGIAFWRTRAINYVWASSQPQGEHWPNAFTANARMIAVRSGAQLQGEWLTERRDVREDYRRLFGEAPGDADAVAIMTDTDNGGGVARACYGAIRFTAPEKTERE